VPKNKVTDPITDQEMAFAHLILSGTMNDRRAAEAVGLNPESAAYTKSKPRVRAYMAEHRAAVRENLVRQESEGLRKLNVGRDKILARLWELASLSPDQTRGNITGQVKALAMFAALGGVFANAPAEQPEEKPAPPPVKAKIYEAAWLRERREQAAKAVCDQQSDPTADTENPPAAASPHNSESESVPGQLPKSPPSPPPSPASALNKPGLANRFGYPEGLLRVPDAYCEPPNPCPRIPSRRIR
jgi:hypothetical protein